MADSEEEGYFSLWDSHLNYISSNNLNAQAANVVAILGLHCSRSLFFQSSKCAEHTRCLVRVKFSLSIYYIHLCFNEHDRTENACTVSTFRCSMRSLRKVF